MKSILFTLCLIIATCYNAQVNTKYVDNSPEITISVYPNPASDFVTINLKGAISNGTIKIYSALGSEVFVDSIENSKKIDLSEFKNNVYIVKIYSKEEVVQTQRFVVRH
jgi:hypothetical protein